MKKLLGNKSVSRWLPPASVAFSLTLIFATAAFAQATPLVNVDTREDSEEAAERARRSAKQKLAPAKKAEKY
jgi:hypothetical protein